MVHLIGWNDLHNIKIPTQKQDRAHHLFKSSFVACNKVVFLHIHPKFLAYFCYFSEWNFFVWCFIANYCQYTGKRDSLFWALLNKESFTNCVIVQDHATLHYHFNFCMWTNKSQAIAFFFSKILFPQISNIREH